MNDGQVNVKSTSSQRQVNVKQASKRGKPRAIESSRLGVQLARELTRSEGCRAQRRASGGADWPRIAARQKVRCTWRYSAEFCRIRPDVDRCPRHEKGTLGSARAGAGACAPPYMAMGRTRSPDSSAVTRYPPAAAMEAPPRRPIHVNSCPFPKAA